MTRGGQAVAERWKGMHDRFPDVLFDAFVVMPDHVHGIVMTGADPDHGAMRTTVGIVVRSFKASVIRVWREGVQHSGWPRYAVHLWQEDFHDRIIRRDERLDDIRAYIEGNPARWEERHRR
jgi:putative transposase